MAAGARVVVRGGGLELGPSTGREEPYKNNRNRPSGNGHELGREP